MLLINEKPFNQLKKEFDQKAIFKFYEENGLQEGKAYEFRRHPNDFHKTRIVTGDQDTGYFIQSASKTKGINQRYVLNNDTVMWVEKYLPPTMNDRADYGRKPKELKFRDVQPITTKDFQFLWFLINHPDRKDSALNKEFKRGSYSFYLYDPVMEAKLANTNRRDLTAARTKIDELQSDMLVMVARGFQITDAASLEPEVIKNRLHLIAEADPRLFVNKFSTAEFTTSSLVYEAEEKGIIFLDRAEHSWYTWVDEGGKKVRGEKIYTYLINEKPHDALINFLRNTNNDWSENISKVLKGSAQLETA